MPTTVPNQRTICVHREKASADFLGIKNRNWMAASRDLGAHALRLYLYLAANANNYSLALSPAALLEEIGMPRSTYHDQFKVLESKGYLIHRSGNTYVAIQCTISLSLLYNGCNRFVLMRYKLCSW